MSKMKIKKLPVVEPHGRLGLITLTDVARFQPQIIYALKPSYKRLFKVNAEFSVSLRRMEKTLEELDAECDRIREKTGRDVDLHRQIRMLLEKLEIYESDSNLSQSLWNAYAENHARAGFLGSMLISESKIIYVHSIVCL